MAKKQELETKEETLKDKDIKIKNFKEDIDKYIKQRVDEETKKGINIKDYKEQIDKYARERVEVETSSQTVKTLKKQLSSKKCASAVKSFIILCLLACIGYGIYYLYKDGYFDENKETKCDCKETKCDIDNDIKDPDKKEDKKETLDSKISKYGYLIENIKFDANSNYTRDYYNGNLTNVLKEYLAYKLIDEENISSDEDSSFIELRDLEKAYAKLFKEDLEPVTFKYNNATYNYLSSKEIFISSNTINESKNIVKEITAIDTDEDTIIITCVEGYVSDSGKLYNILSNKEVSGYKDGDKLSKYQNKLNTIKYVFDGKYLTDIRK